MTVTAEDYERALEAFVADLHGRLGDDLVGVILYGSVARREVRPGRSDLLDAYVYLSDEVFADRERFFAAFEAMLAACDGLARTGLPYQHPFQYWSADELGHVPALYRSQWWSDEDSRAVYGGDLRRRMSSTQADITVARSTFFGARRMGHHLTAYLLKGELTEEDREKMTAGVKTLLKFVPATACVALDIWVGARQAVPALLEALPGLDADRVRRLYAFAGKDGAGCGAEELREVLRETLGFIEELHDEVLARWQAMGEVAG